MRNLNNAVDVVLSYDFFIIQLKNPNEISHIIAKQLISG